MGLKKKYESHHEKTFFAYVKTKVQKSQTGFLTTRVKYGMMRILAVLESTT